MRVVHIEAGRHLYGGAAQVGYLLGGLADQRVDNVLLCPSGSEVAVAQRAAADVVPLPMRGELDITLPLRLARAIRRVAPDLVHVHSRRGADLYGGLAAGLAGVPAVITRRVDAAEPAWVARSKYRPYGAVVALSRAIETQLRGYGIDEARLVRIPSAVDAARYRPDAGARRRLRATFGLPDRALVVGVVAQFIERKRHAWLFALLPELVQRQPNAHVLCFGRGPLERQLRDAIAARGLGARVTFTGFRTDLPRLMPGLDVLAHPASREGLGVALLEAGSAGVPVVACAVGGVVDVVEGGRTGVLVAADDAAGFARALDRLLRSPGERQRLGAAARVRVERHFSVGALVEAHLSLYRRVLGAPRAAAVSTVLR